MSILLDSGVLVAFYNHDDQNHLRSIDVLNNIKENSLGTQIISDYIFDETITLLKKYLGNKKTSEIGEYLLSNLEFKEVDPLLFQISWQLSKKFSDLSFTDCTNLVLMQHYNINHLATFDSGFDGLVSVLK